MEFTTSGDTDIMAGGMIMMAFQSLEEIIDVSVAGFTIASTVCFKEYVEPIMQNH
jgi:hypothetical protein